MIIRRLAYNDIPSCLHIVNENWGQTISQSCHIEFGQAFGNAVWKPIFYVVEIDQTVVGMAGYAVSWMNYGIYDITWVNVDPLFQRNGIGKMLVSRCIDDIKAIGSLIMISTDIPDYYKQHWGFIDCFKYGKDSIMRLELGEGTPLKRT